MRLEETLILNRYFHGLFDARDLTELKQPLNVQEGRAADGQSYFYRALEALPLEVAVDLTPQVTALAGENLAAGQLGRRREIHFGKGNEMQLLDFDALYADLIEYKVLRGYHNLFVSRPALAGLLERNHLFMAESDAGEPARLPFLARHLAHKHNWGGTWRRSRLRGVSVASKE